METEWCHQLYLDQHNEPDPMCDGHLEDCERILYLPRRDTPADLASILNHLAALPI